MGKRRLHLGKTMVVLVVVMAGCTRLWAGRSQSQSLLRGGRLRKHVHPMTATPKVFRADIRWRWRDGVTPVFPAQNDLVGKHRHIIVERSDLDVLHGVIG